MTIEDETTFHFRRRGERLVLAMVDPAPRWGFDEQVDETTWKATMAVKLGPISLSFKTDVKRELADGSRTL